MATDKKVADRIELLTQPNWAESDTDTRLSSWLAEEAAEYLVRARDDNGRPLDPVARFHLGNGARLEQININADHSERGLQQSFGMMVNYLYDLEAIEANHEAYANRGSVVCSRAVQRLLAARQD
jgi:malonyl-CoA decarboxylase